MFFEVRDPIVSFCASQLLGDGHNVNNTSIVISHSDSQLCYLTWKREIATSLGLHVSNIKRTVKPCTFGIQAINTFCVSGLGNYLRPLAGVNVRVLVKSLNSLGLLLWWLDDGCLSVHEKKNNTSISRFGYLGTEGYNFEQNDVIRNTLYEDFNLRTVIHRTTGGIFGKDRVYYRQYFNATALRGLIDIVRPHIRCIPVDMRYKFNMCYRPCKTKTSELYTVLYNF